MNTLKRNLPAILMIVLSIALGVLLIIDAEMLTEYVFRICGIGLIVLAVVMVIRYLFDRKEGDETPLTLIGATVALVIGLVLTIASGDIVRAGSTLCAIFYGTMLIVSGVFKISEYFSLKKAGYPASGIRILSGVLSTLLGAAAIIFCGQALKVVGMIIGISLLVQSVLDIAALAVGYRRGKNVGSIYDTSGDDSDYDLE